MPRAWKLTWRCKWLHAPVPMQHRNFPNARKIQKTGFCENFAFATLTTRVAARHASKPAQNVPRAWELSWRCNWLHAQLPMQHRNFSSALKIKKTRFCEKFAFATLATRVAARHASKPAQNVPRTWQLSWRCNGLHAQLAMQHRNFSSALKMKKTRFCEKFAFATLATRVAARHASKPAQNVPRAWELS